MASNIQWYSLWIIWSTTSKQDLFLCLWWRPLLGFQGPVLWIQLCLSSLTGRTPPPYLSSYCKSRWPGTRTNRWVPRTIEVHAFTFTRASIVYDLFMVPRIGLTSYGLVAGFWTRTDPTQKYTVWSFLWPWVPGIDSCLFFFFQTTGSKLASLFDSCP